MYGKKVNIRITDAVRRAIASKEPGPKGCGRWKSGDHLVEWSPLRVFVSYRGNTVFEYEKKTGDWRFDACGWETNTSRDKINAAMEGAGIPIRTFRKNYAFSARNIETKAEWIDCGAGSVSKADVECAGL